MIPGSDAAIGMGAHPDRGARDLLKVLFETNIDRFGSSPGIASIERQTMMCKI